MDEDYVYYDPIYPLYMRRFARGFSVHRMADDARIATIIVRDMSQVISHQWDPIKGKFLSVFYKDGIVRIHDGFSSGRLVSLLRAGANGAISGIWDRIELKGASGAYGSGLSVDHDVTKMMPKMVKFARDSRQLCVVPYTIPSDVWRPSTYDEKEALLDVHIIRTQDGLSMMFDGELSMYLPLKSVSFPLVKFVLAQHQYLAFYQDGSVERLHLANLTGDSLCSRLLKTVMSMRQLYRYMEDHIELIQRDLILPYDEFLERSCLSAFGEYKLLKRELIDLMLIGDVTPQLQDWLVNSIGEKNLKRWRKLGTDAYHKTLQVLTLACLPACERLISLGQRCRGTLLSLSHQLGSSSFLSSLPSLDLLQFFLKRVLEAISCLSSQQRLLGSFLDWFDDRVHESIDEDYKLRFSLHDKNSLGADLESYLDLRLRSLSPEFSKIQDLSYSISKIRDCISLLESVLTDQLTTKIFFSYQSSEKNNDPLSQPLDLTVIKVGTSVSSLAHDERELILLATRSQILLLDPQSLITLAQLALELPLSIQEKQDFASPFDSSIIRAHWQRTTLKMELLGIRQNLTKIAIPYCVSFNVDRWSLAVL